MNPFNKAGLARKIATVSLGLVGLGAGGSAVEEYLEEKAQSDLSSISVVLNQIPLEDRLGRPMSAEFGALVEQHLKRIFEAGYAQEISLDDLFHGHIIFDVPANQADLAALHDGDLSQVKMVLYHTDESIQRWSVEEDQVPADELTPRSVVGLLDGSVVPADQFLSGWQKLTLKNYRRFGTVHANDITGRPERDEAGFLVENHQFLIGVGSEPRFECAVGPFDVYLCP